MSEVNLKIIFPGGSFGRWQGDSCLDSILRDIAIAACSNPDAEWPDKYGTDFENNVFMMHQFCWCEREDCGWCKGKNPNFLFKPNGFSVIWYKYIGRGVETSGDVPDLSEMKRLCVESVKNK